MAISADDVFAETMSPELIKASDLRTKEIIQEFETLQQLRKARSLTQEHIGESLVKSRSRLRSWKSGRIFFSRH